MVGVVLSNQDDLVIDVEPDTTRVTVQLGCRGDPDIAKSCPNRSHEGLLVQETRQEKQLSYKYMLQFWFAEVQPKHMLEAK